MSHHADIIRCSHSGSLTLCKFIPQDQNQKQNHRLRRYSNKHPRQDLQAKSILQSTRQQRGQKKNANEREREAYPFPFLPRNGQRFRSQEAHCVLLTAPPAKHLARPGRYVVGTYTYPSPTLLHLRRVPFPWSLLHSGNHLHRSFTFFFPRLPG